MISGGGTGTYDLAAQAGALTEIQVGSYVLMDGRYGTLDLPFEPALYCVTTVISRRPSRAVLLIPAHVDPAVNLYDRLFAWSGTGFTEWEVDGRRHYRLPGFRR